MIRYDMIRYKFISSYVVQCVWYDTLAAVFSRFTLVQIRSNSSYTNIFILFYLTLSSHLFFHLSFSFYYIFFFPVIFYFIHFDTIVRGRQYLIITVLYAILKTSFISHVNSFVKSIFVALSYICCSAIVNRTKILHLIISII